MPAGTSKEEAERLSLAAPKAKSSLTSKAGKFAKLLLSRNVWWILSAAKRNDLYFKPLTSEESDF